MAPEIFQLLSNRHYGALYLRYGYHGYEHAASMRHIIDRVLELQDSDSEPPNNPAPQDGDLAELLKTLQPRIRVYGCGGCGNNTVSRLTQEGLLDDQYLSLIHI